MLRQRQRASGAHPHARRSQDRTVVHGAPQEPTGLRTTFGEGSARILDGQPPSCGTHGSSRPWCGTYARSRLPPEGNGELRVTVTLWTLVGDHSPVERSADTVPFRVNSIRMAWVGYSAAVRGCGVPVDVITEVLIDCPPEQVAEFAADPDRASQWYANIESFEWRSDMTQ